MGVILPALLAAALAVLFSSACESAKAPPRSTVSLRLRGTPPNAAVTIDDEALGALELVERRGVALPPGMHRVTVQARGYFPWDREVGAQEGAPPITIEVTLTPVPN